MPSPHTAMQIAGSFRSLFRGPRDRRHIQPHIQPFLTPLPISNDSERPTRSVPPATHVAREQRPPPPLPFSGDGHIFASIHTAELPRPLSPPPMYDYSDEDTPTNSSTFTPLTRPFPSLPIDDRDQSINSSTFPNLTGPLIRPLPLGPTDIPAPSLSLSTNSSCVRPLPDPPSTSKLSIRPLPPLPVRDEKSPAGFFNNAKKFVLNHAKFTEHVNHIHNSTCKERTVFDLLEPYTMLEATKDSSARYPPPQCHPKTRLRIRTKLMNWLHDENHEWKMICLFGLPGTGKSALAQTFADSCDEENRLGGTYFFSTIAGRNKLETLVPTLAYQLAIFVPEYKSIISAELANDPLLLRSSPPVQLKKLIVQPFTTLQRERHRETIVIVLDALDECEGRNAQWTILEMISESHKTTLGLPLRWLIFCRPQPYLRQKFLQLVAFGLEELVIDTECRREVGVFVRGRIAEIKATYGDVIPRNWPSLDELRKLVDEASGFFGVASASLEKMAAVWDARFDAFSNLVLYGA